MAQAYLRRLSRTSKVQILKPQRDIRVKWLTFARTSPPVGAWWMETYLIALV
jgi:hypothetical protein